MNANKAKGEKYECDIHSCSGQSPDGKCQLCVYDEMKTKP